MPVWQSPLASIQHEKHNYKGAEEILGNSAGLNTFISGQGRAKTAMMSVLIGAVINIVLDPVFIFVLHRGVMGIYRAGAHCRYSLGNYYSNPLCFYREKKFCVIWKKVI